MDALSLEGEEATRCSVAAVMVRGIFGLMRGLVASC